MKTIESIQFDTANNEIVVTYDDESTAMYGPDDAARYVEENPARDADVLNLHTGRSNVWRHGKLQILNQHLNNLVHVLIVLFVTGEKRCL